VIFGVLVIDGVVFVGMHLFFLLVSAGSPLVPFPFPLVRTNTIPNKAAHRDTRHSPQNLHPKLEVEVEVEVTFVDVPCHEWLCILTPSLEIRDVTPEVNGRSVRRP
jgi:hypothetical protein